MINNQNWMSFEGAFRGDLFRPGDDGYDGARRIYNAMIDKKPAIIARCANVADVIRAVHFARDNNLLTAIRGGGHNGAGLALCDDGLVIDLSRMKETRVQPGEKTVRVGPGCTWGDVDHAGHVFGLAVPAGIISTTGVGGLTLGGGHGYLTRKYGMTVDNLLEADVVLADGRLVTASETSHPDLFWALRGGGGNFGVVTSFLFRGRPVSQVVAGPTLYPLEKSGQVLHWYREILDQLPRDLYGFFMFMQVPPVDLFPAELHNRGMCGVMWCYSGRMEEADAVFKPIREFGPPAFSHIGPVPFPALQTLFDGLYPPGQQWYWKGDFVRELGDEAIAIHQRFGSDLPTPQSTMHLYPVDGATHQVAEGATAFSYRDVKWSMVIAGVDPDPASEERLKTWARNYWKALHPYSAGGAYVNFMMEEEPDRVRTTYRGNYERLARVKKEYDPGNLFRMNWNITPSA